MVMAIINFYCHKDKTALPAGNVFRLADAVCWSVRGLGWSENGFFKLSVEVFKLENNVFKPENIVGKLANFIRRVGNFVRMDIFLVYFLQQVVRKPADNVR
jgi:hypothetical protein